MPKSFFSLLLLLSSFSLFAQSNTAAKVETAKITNIRKLLTLTGSGKLGVQVMQNMISNFKTKFTAVDPSFWDDFMKEVKPDDLVNLIVPVYDRNFTEEEIDGVVTFYRSPVGQKVLTKLPMIVQESMEVGRAWGEELSNKVIQKLKQKGYITLSPAAPPHPASPNTAG